MDCFHNEIKTFVPIGYKYLEGSSQSCNMYIGGTYCMKAYWD
ncbi:transcriptional regulator, partial [Escherichia coli]